MEAGRGRGTKVKFGVALDKSDNSLIDLKVIPVQLLK